MTRSVTTQMQTQTQHVVFLSANDVYKLLPADDGMGGVAQFATMLDQVKASVPTDAYVIVTMNGDFLWRTELERPEKAELMVKILHDYGVDFAVLGNHEFDFGAARCLELLPSMKFTVLGSNVRLREGNGLLPGVQDTEIIEIPQSGIKIGIFGVLTSNPHEYVHQDDPLIVLESEVEHAKRCVRALQLAGADVIVALTHTRLAKDRLIARQVPGIHLILGGHDHEPFTMFEKTTLIHKSGCDALWLAQIDLFVTKTVAKDVSSDEGSLEVQFGWKMLPNRGYQPKPSVQKLLDAFFNSEQVDATMLESLAVTRTWLDGTRLTMRTQESNLGNLVADAMRSEMGADVAFVNGGFIQGERKYKPGSSLTRAWLKQTLPIPNIARCVQVKAKCLHDALLLYLKKYPDEDSAHPHVSGVYLVLNVIGESKQLRMYRDREHQIEIRSDESLRVVSSPFMFEEAEGADFFMESAWIADGPSIRDVVAAFLLKIPGGEVAYKSKEGRIMIQEEDSH